MFTDVTGKRGQKKQQFEEKEQGQKESEEKKKL